MRRLRRTLSALTAVTALGGLAVALTVGGPDGAGA
jgi:hypothetical protein